MSAFSMTQTSVPLMIACFLPSGDHTGERYPFVKLVSAHGSPPVKGRIKICPGCGFPSCSTARTNDSFEPSGDHRGEVSLMPLVSRCGALPPPVATVHSDVS